MEQKKTLWIIAAVGLFLLVVLGGACLVYSPAKKTIPTITSTKAPEKQPVSGWSNPPEVQNNNPDFQRPDFNALTGKVNEMIVVSENTTLYDLNKTNTPEVSAPAASTSTGTTIDLNTLKREFTAELAAAAQSQPQNINITVTMPEKEVAPVIITPNYSSEQKETASVVKTVEKKETTVASTKPAEKAPAQKTESKPAASTSTKPAATATASASTAKTNVTVKAETAAPKPVTRYWVQVAAYTNKKTAEVARESLTANKITSDIFTYEDAKNRLFYRVRVGPYTTKSEAEYWQAKISKIDDFKNSQSYVTSTTD